MNKWIKNKQCVLIPIREAGFIQPGVAMFRGKPQSGAGDPYWNNVITLFYLDGSESGWTDQKGRAWNVEGNAPTYTTVDGINYLYLDGSGALVSPDSDGAFGGDDFTIEFFYRVETTPPSNPGILSKRRSFSSGNHDWSICVKSRSFSFEYNATYKILGDIPANGTDAYIAFTRHGTTLQSWKDGAVTDTATIPATLPSTDGLPMAIGRSSTGAYTRGYIRAIRITKGIVRDVSVVPNAPFPNHA